MTRIEFHPGALEDARDALHWYSERSVSAADRFQTELHRTVDLVAALPTVGGPSAFGTRRARLHGFPHALIYRVLSDALLVLAVAHERRTPGYWTSR